MSSDYPSLNHVAHHPASLPAGYSHVPTAGYPPTDPSTTHQTLEGLTEDQVLNYTQRRRIQVIDELMRESLVPENTGAKVLLAQLLDGLDRAALTNKKIKIDAKANQSSMANAAMIAELLSQVQINRTIDIPNVINNFTPPALGHDVPVPLLVPGETEINPEHMTYESFMNAYNSSNPSSGD